MGKNRRAQAEPKNKVPIPHKFQLGDRVKPTQEAITLGWKKPGVVQDCGVHCVAVLMDCEAQYSWYSVDYWELEGNA